MSGKAPSFLTGANAKIKAGGITIAYAQDTSYNVTVTTIPIETMGRYEVVSNEPVAYFVDGTLSVIRYTKIANANGMDKTAINGNGLGNWNMNTGQAASDQVNPGALLGSKTWDLDVFQKDTSGSTKVVTITDCRFIRQGSSITKRGVLTEQYAFNGILKSDDSFTASLSGDDDLSVS